MNTNSKVFSATFIALSIAAFGFNTWNDFESDQSKTPDIHCAPSNNLAVENHKKVYSNFSYNLGSRFSPLKKGDLNNVKSIVDFLPEEETRAVVSYKSVSVITIENDKQTDIRETGKTDVLTTEQLSLLHSFNYSTNFLIRADYLGVNEETGKFEDNYFSPHLTIVPEKQASYMGGKDLLLAYLRENNRENTANLNEDNLQPAKLYFTVTTTGEVSNVKLDKTSGYLSIDDKMIQLITNTPEKWIPAENSKGEKVNQELVISFGMLGC